MNYIPVNVASPAIYRGGTLGGTTVIRGQSLDCNWSWGSEPASATLIYLSSQVPVSVGNWLTIPCAGHRFYGVCKSDTDKFGSGGSLRELTFVDSREYLDWDLIYAAFNRPDNRIVAGRRIRRWKHLLPANYNFWRWTYTDAPLTAAQILDYVFSAGTVQDPWIRTYHSDQLNFPIQELDATSGVKLKAVLQDISDRQGLTFTLTQAGRFNLLWARKGEGTIPSFPVDSDNRELGSAISGHPTRIRIIGDRNVYQVHDIPMAQDWPTVWNAIYDRIIFEDIIFNTGVTKHEVIIKPEVGSDVLFSPGTPFTSIATSGSDPEGYVAHQLAAALAATITVREFSEMSNGGGLLAQSNSAFADTRRWSGRSRMEMPCYSYISNILFRAFKLPNNFSFRNGDNLSIAADGAKMTGTMTAKVTHNPVTGVMTWDYSDNPDGNGYAIIKGYQLGQDMFRTIKPENFNLSAWTKSTEIWQHVSFSLDDSSETAKDQFILFDAPVINSSDLVTIVDGLAVFNARPTITSPPVLASICFEAEKFSYVKGTGTKDAAESVGSLYAEHVQSYGGTPTQIPFIDGQTATTKADIIATSLLNRQFIYAKGGFKRHLVPVNGVFPTGTQLTGVIDKVSLTAGPAGITEDIGFTSELPNQFYVPVRDLERMTMLRELLPGQAELRAEANSRTMVAHAMARDPEARKNITDAMRDAFGLPAQSSVRIGPSPP